MLPLHPWLSLEAKQNIWDDEVLVLLKQYDNIFAQLKSRRIRTTAHLISGLGEHIASKLLRLTINSNSHEIGYDATDEDGYKYEVKTTAR